MAKDPTLWCIAHIDPKLMYTIDRDLMQAAKYNLVQVYIPTIKILTKQVKGKKHYQTIPLLFNYGFFKVPKYFVPNSHFLDQMKKEIECIKGWVKDKAVGAEKGFFTMDKTYNPSRVAIASDSEIANIRKRENDQQFYTPKDIETLKAAKTITLHSYPFEGLPAEVIEVNTKQEYVKVKLLLGKTQKEMKVGFENVLFSIYKEDYFSDEMKEDYIDDIKARHKNIENVMYKDERD